MKLKVKVNYPNDIKILEDKIAEVMAKIIVNKLSDYEIKQLVEVLKNEFIDIKW